jgi:peptidyl-prolyl cis-trans isomerase C
MRFKVFSGIILTVLSLSGCDLLNNPSKIIPATKKSIGDVVAEVNGDYITLEDLNKEIDALNVSLASQDPNLKIDSVDKKKEYLKDMIDRKLLYQEAIARGLDRDPEILQQGDNFKVNLLVTKLLSDEMKGLEVSAQDVENAYQEIKDRLKEPEQRHVREIVVPTKNEANEILAQLLTGSDFGEIAMQRSKAKSSSKGGDLGFIARGSKGEGSDFFDSVVFSPTLEVGSLSQVFKATDGYYIVKLEEQKDGRQIALSEVHDKIKQSLQQQKQQEKIKSIIDKIYQQKQAKIIKYESKIK